jgi:hypothetical protein
VPTAVPTATPALNSPLAFNPDTEVVAYPNPRAANTPMAIDFTLTKSADKVTFKLYSASQRLIKVITKTKNEMLVYPNAGGLNNGRNVMTINWSEINGLAQGTYYYVVIAEDSKGQAKSKIEKMILLK